MLWLDPTNPEAFPAGLVEVVERGGDGMGGQRSVEEQLRVQMRADALRPLDDEDGEDLPKKADSGADDGVPLPPRSIEEATQFLQLNVSFLRLFMRHVSFPVSDVGLTWVSMYHDKPVERLDRVLRYLRAEYHYCFWCGTQYKSSDEMQEECPGPDEDMHD